MILHSYVEQVRMMCRIQKWELSLITFWVISPLILFYGYSCPLCNLNTLWNIIMILHSYRYIEQAMTMCRDEEWQLSLSYFLSYFPLIVSDAVSCQLHNLNTLWHIIMILHSYVEQAMAINGVQKWHISFSYFLSYFPLIVSDAIPCQLHNLNTLWYIMILHSSWQCVTYKDNSRFYTFGVISPWLFQFPVCSITWIPFGILSWYFTVM